MKQPNFLSNLCPKQEWLEQYFDEVVQLKTRLMQFVNIRFASTFPVSWPIASAKTWRARRATSSRGNGQRKNAILYQVWPLTCLPNWKILSYFYFRYFILFFNCDLLEVLQVKFHMRFYCRMLQSLSYFLRD